MSQNVFHADLEYARAQDAQSPLAAFRNQFYMPLHEGKPMVYLVGNSLGLQPTRTASYIKEELDKWQAIGVRGHFSGDYPWMPYHEFLTEPMAKLVGGLNSEVVIMNSLTANLHLMMATFYRPTSERNMILIEDHAFPSDHFAVESQIRWHGYDPSDAMMLLKPNPGSQTFKPADVLATIEEYKDRLALILLPGVQYYTGQVFEIQRIAELAQSYGITVGFDLAHAVGNIELQLHDWNVDFAVWCTYKYLNSGPGAVGGCFVHERHARQVDKPRLAGWWGHDKETRFLMKNEMQAMPTAEGWQLSNPPVFSLAAIRASLEIFSEAGGMGPLVARSQQLTSYLEQRLSQQLPDQVKVITPACRGCQLSLELVAEGKGRQVYQALCDQGVETDCREPNVIRVAAVPLYNTFEDVFHFVEILKSILSS